MYHIPVLSMPTFNTGLKERAQRILKYDPFFAIEVSTLYSKRKHHQASSLAKEVTFTKP